MVEERYEASGQLTLYFGANETDVFGWLNIHNSKNMTLLHMLSVVRFLGSFLEESPTTFETILDSQGALRPVLGGIRYIDTDTLNGVLYIPAPRGVPITRWLTYEFQGFTKDGQYYLSGGYSIRSGRSTR